MWRVIITNGHQIDAEFRNEADALNFAYLCRNVWPEDAITIIEPDGEAYEF